MSKMVPIISGEELGIRNFRLYSICSEQFSYKIGTHTLHRHDCFELLWLTSGSAKIQIDFQQYNYVSNQLCLISPGQIHRLIENESVESISGYLLIFSKEMLTGNELENINGSSLSLFQLLGENPFYNINQEQVTFFHDIFRLLKREQATGFNNRELAIRSYLHLILIELGRITDVWQQAHEEEAGFRLTKQYLILVNSHFQEVNSISEYANLLHVTTNHLVESVKKTLGKTPGTVLRERQLLEAKRLLRYSNKPVNEIASKLNYKDPSYFGRFFKKYIGMSPTEFRNETK